MPKPLPDIRELRRRFNYNPETGVISYAVRRGNMLRGADAGTIDRAGYVRVRFQKDGKTKRLRAHRVAWALHYGHLNESDFIDHANGARADNRILNLRLATPSQNSANSKKSSRGKLPKGVWLSRGKFRACIVKDGKRCDLGHFGTLQGALSAYRDAAQKHFGAFARFE